MADKFEKMAGLPGERIRTCDYCGAVDALNAPVYMNWLEGGWSCREHLRYDPYVVTITNYNDFEIYTAEDGLTYFRPAF